MMLWPVGRKCWQYWPTEELALENLYMSVFMSFGPIFFYGCVLQIYDAAALFLGHMY